MIFIPKGTVVMASLSSYYIDIEKLCEYYHEIIGSCCIYFHSPSASVKGVLYYDNAGFLGGGLRTRMGEDVDTADVVEKIIDFASHDNFDITIYRIDPDDVYYWSSLFNVRSLYSDLKSEFTDLSALVEKMKTEELSGYIEILYQNSHRSNIFFCNGRVVHSFCTISENSPGEAPPADGDLPALINFVKKKKAVYNVKEIMLRKPVPEKKVDDSVLAGGGADLPEINADRVFMMLASLLASLRLVLESKYPQGFNFNLILKKKFVEKADQYDFLDPFAAEFQYDGSKVSYQGDADLKFVASAVFESVLELAGEHDLVELLKSEIVVLRNEYPKEMTELGYGS